MILQRTTLVAALAGALLAAPLSAQTEIKIGYALAPAPDSHYGVGAERWQEVVEERTDGRYKFRHFPSSGLGGEREMVEGVQLGTVEAVIVSSGTLANFVEDAGVFDIPFLFRDLDHARSVLDGPIG
ncbi:MAG: TRAP transporter substrate-binding protein DctP, partial [Rhodosalinus sp.]